MRKRGCSTELETRSCIVVMRSMGTLRSTSATAWRSGPAIFNGSTNVRRTIVGRASTFGACAYGMYISGAALVSLFRRVEVRDKEKGETIVFLTNLIAFGATTIAAIYKERWQVELFFETSTWCTPLDVMKFQGSIALNRPLVGSLDGFVRPRIVRQSALDGWIIWSNGRSDRPPALAFAPGGDLRG